ncbi:MAG: hypothetical protein ABL958_01950 [Bdellovibrionia bacterium]
MLTNIKQSLRSNFSNDGFERDFKGQLEDLCALAGREGIRIRPHSEKSWAKFLELDSERQLDAVANFELYRSVCAAAIDDGRALTDDVSLLWHVIKKMELRPRSDLFDKLSADDVIEIYDASFIQIFRNFKFFDICSYSLADIFMYEWRDLYIREPAVTARMAQQGIAVFSGQVQGTVPVNVDDHFLEEAFGPLKLKMKMRAKYFSPLYNKQNEVAAVVATSCVDVIGTKAAETEASRRPLELV